MLVAPDRVWILIGVKSFWLYFRQIILTELLKQFLLTTIIKLFADQSEVSALPAGCLRNNYVCVSFQWEIFLVRGKWLLTDVEIHLLLASNWSFRYFLYDCLNLSVAIVNSLDVAIDVSSAFLKTKYNFLEPLQMIKAFRYICSLLLLHLTKDFISMSEQWPHDYCLKQKSERLLFPFRFRKLTLHQSQEVSRWCLACGPREQPTITEGCLSWQWSISVALLSVNLILNMMSSIHLS